MVALAYLIWNASQGHYGFDGFGMNGYRHKKLGLGQKLHATLRTDYFLPPAHKSQLAMEGGQASGVLDG